MADGLAFVVQIVRLRQKDFKFEDSLGHRVQGFIAGLCLKTNKRRTVSLLMHTCHPLRGGVVGRLLKV